MNTINEETIQNENSFTGYSGIAKKLVLIMGECSHVATHCNIPAQLCALNPVYGTESFGFSSLIGPPSNTAANDTEHDPKHELLQIADIIN